MATNKRRVTELSEDSNQTNQSDAPTIHNAKDIMESPHWTVFSITEQERCALFRSDRAIGSTKKMAWWNNNGIGPHPSVIFNNTNEQQTYNPTEFWTASELTLHPGPNGEQVSLEWMSPASHTYRIKAEFYGKVAPGNEHVWIKHQETNLLSQDITGLQSTKLDHTMTVNAGENISFVVGLGEKKSYHYNLVGLRAQIKKV